MKILMLGTLPGPGTGGVATMCLNLFRGLCNKKQIFFINTASGKPYEITSPGLDSGCHAHWLNRFGNLWYLLRLPRFVLRRNLLINYLSAIWEFRSSFRFGDAFHILKILILFLENFPDHDIDLIHSMHALDRSFAAVIIKNWLDIPLAVTVMGLEFTYEPIFRRYKPISEYIVEKADKVIAISHFTQETAANATGRSDIDVIHLGVDTERFNPHNFSESMAANHGLAGNALVLYVGHLTERKGADVLVRSIPFIPGDRTRYLFIGSDHGDLGRLKKLAEDFNIKDKVRFFGEVSLQELAAWYATADLLVFPTTLRTEGFGLVALEAMASGTPVVASRIGAIPEIVLDGDTGILVSPGDPEDLAQAIDRLLSDKRSRNEMGQKAVYRATTQFSWKITIQNHISLYESLAASRTTGQKP